MEAAEKRTGVETVNGAGLLDRLLGEVARIGIRPVSRLSGVPAGTIMHRIHRPHLMRADELFKLAEAVGGGVMLMLAPEPKMELDGRRRHVRQMKRQSPNQRPLPTSPAQ